MSDPVEEFRTAVEAEFGAPWHTEATVDGFVARYPLSQAQTAELTASDEVHVRVVLDPAAKTFAFTTRRVAASDFERERAGWSLSGYRATRESRSTRYSGLRRTMVFRRTPEGLVPAPESSQDSAGREADLRAVAARLGWTEEGAAGGADISVKLPPKGRLIFIAVFFGVVILFIAGIAVFVISQVAGAFLR